MDTTYTENLIIGAGFSGLTMAALLAQNKQEVIVLEAHSLSGGCAGFFRRGEFFFDAGATTLSGLKEFGALKAVIDILGLKLPLIHCDPGLVMHRTNGEL